MNVTTKSTGDLNAILTVELTQEDYQPKVEKVLSDYRKRANIPGFRPGKVPAGLIRKQYGKAVLIDEVNHLLQHAVYDYIKDEKLDILGNPLPVPNDTIDWDNQTDFTFEFEIGLAPEVNVTISDKVKVPYYKIVADKKMVDRYVEDYARRFGKMSYPGISDDKSIFKGNFTEVDEAGTPVEGGISAEGTFSMESVEDKKAVKALTGLKKGDKVTFDVKKAFKEEFNTARLLDLTKEQFKAISNPFEFELTELSRLEPAELNKELFDKVFGEGETNTEEEFRKKVKEDAERMFVSESDRQFYQDVKDAVLEKTRFDLPDAFLKKWIQTSQEKPVTPEEIEEEYPKMKEGMKWQLVENHVIRENNIEVTQEELVNYAKELIARQMMQYGQQPTEEDLNAIVKNVLENKDEVQRITDQLFSEKLLTFFKENVKLKEKEVSFDEFLKQANK